MNYIRCSSSNKTPKWHIGGFTHDNIAMFIMTLSFLNGILGGCTYKDMIMSIMTMSFMGLLESASYDTLFKTLSSSAAV